MSFMTAGKTLKLGGVVLFVAALAACGGITKTVDGKSTVEVPATDGHPASVCYMLEIEVTDDASGEEQEEGFHCVSKAEYDKNNVGSEWVDVNGTLK